ncbi:MAG: carbohydrate-binding domain-containing protein [Bacteroidales bacterium]|nr:carbohydrate-binding domain-containing protein [Bacteroidales bacterium]
MSRSLKSLRFFLYIVTVFLAISSLFVLINPHIYDYLSPSSRIKANAMVVEGWMPPYALELSYSEYIDGNYSHIYTSGLRSPDYYLMAMNGYLIFYLPDEMKQGKNSDYHMIEINAGSEMHGAHAAHFNVYVNDSLTAGFTTQKRKKKYGLRWYGKTENIDSISIQFDNDRHGNFGDRNLYVKSIIIDGKQVISYQYNSVYDIGEPGGRNRKINNSVSYAEIARNKLISMGVDSSAITAIPGERVNIRRTLVSAIAVKDYLNENETGIKTINIVSLGVHSRRTWLTYKTIMGGDYKTGIIALEDHKTSRSRKRMVLKTARESFALLFYTVLLTLY